jgi:hypothetical protein
MFISPRQHGLRAGPLGIARDDRIIDVAALNGIPPRKVISECYCVRKLQIADQATGMPSP